MNYNKKRHIELLKRNENFKSQKKSFLKEDPQECLELLNYSAAVDDHIFWENRFEVASIIETFVNKKMDEDEFHDTIFELRRKHLAKCDKFLSDLVLEKKELKDFYPNKKSNKLSGFLSSLYFECENFEDNRDEEEFYSSIRNGFLKFQKVLNEE